MDVTRKSGLILYRRLQLIRQTELALARAHQRGLVHGACHTYVGQEAIAAGVCSQTSEWADARVHVTELPR